MKLTRKNTNRKEFKIDSTKDFPFRVLVHDGRYDWDEPIGELWTAEIYKTKDDIDQRVTQLVDLGFVMIK